MRIIVVGAGSVGFNLAEQLSVEKHDVSIVESEDEIVKRIAPKLDCQVILGNGASPQVLERAGIKEAQMVIAVTNSDERNMIVSLLAKNYGVETRIARIRNPDYTDPGSKISRTQLAIDRVINPEEIAVDTIEKLIFTAGATEIVDFADHKILLVGFLVPKDAPIAGRSLQQIGEIISEFLIVAIHRGPQVIVPSGSDTIEADDRIYVLMPREIVPLFLGQLYRRVEKVRKVVIFGASRIGVALAKRLEGQLSDVTILDDREDRCTRAAEALDKATVLRGSALDPDVLEEIRVQHAQVFCALSEDDAANTMSALLAKDHGARKAIVNLAEPDFVPIAERIGLDAAINPQLLAVNIILRYVRAGHIVSIAHFEELKAECVELVVPAQSEVAGKKIAELAPRIPKGALIGAIVRGERMVIPRGGTTIELDERVIVFSTQEALPKVHELFAAPKK